MKIQKDREEMDLLEKMREAGEPLIPPPKTEFEKLTRSTVILGNEKFKERLLLVAAWKDEMKKKKALEK